MDLIRICLFDRMVNVLEATGKSRCRRAKAIAAGLEPAISGSVDRCLIQFGHATRIFVVP